MGIIIGFILLLMSWVIYYHAVKYCGNIEFEEFEKLIALILGMSGLLLSGVAILHELLG